MRSLLLLLVGLGAAPAWAQQSFFNVPSGTRTSDHHVFLQEQLNLTASGESNFTAATGLGLGFETGFNVFHVDVYGDHVSQSARNLFMANLVWTSSFSEVLTLQVGVQGGMGRYEADGRYDVAVLGWALVRYDWHRPRLAGVLGVYGGTPAHLGAGWPAGPMAALEWTAIPGWLALQADLMFGRHESAVAVVGASLLLKYGWQLSVGALLPSPLSDNDFGVVVEVTRVPEFDTPPRERRIVPGHVREASPEEM
ncbi:MAG: hypothetical protein AB1938_24230 [Myxococcota bacterium]